MRKMLGRWKENMMQGVKKEIKQKRIGIDEPIKEQGRVLKEEIKKLKKGFREQVELWKEAREKMKGRINKMEESEG